MCSVGLLGFFLLIFFLTGFFFLYFFLLVKCFLLLSVLPRQLVKCPVPFRSFSSTVHSASKISSGWTPVGLMKLEWSQIVGFVLMRRFFFSFYFFFRLLCLHWELLPKKAGGQSLAGQLSFPGNQRWRLHREFRCSCTHLSVCAWHFITVECRYKS